MTTETVKPRTIADWLSELAEKNESSERDSVMMEQFMRRIGFSKARVVMGIVYADGHGTPDSPPVDIHTMAKMMLKAKGIA